MKRRNIGRPGGTTKVISKAFFWSEPAYFVGGPGGWLNGRIADCEAELLKAGATRPFGVRFGGGDGRVNPVIMEVFEA